MSGVEIHLNVNNVKMDSNVAVKQINAYHELLMADHLRGRHPYGRMRRDCPLCISTHRTLDEA
jgi:hypothetical protein